MTWAAPHTRLRPVQAPLLDMSIPLDSNMKVHLRLQLQL
jgi:hypothetical protein